MHVLTAVSSIPGTRTSRTGFLGTGDWIFKFGIPWGFGDSMVLGVLGIRALGSSRGAVGLGGTGELGMCTLGFGIPQSQNGGSKFWGPPKGKSLLKK